MISMSTHVPFTTTNGPSTNELTPNDSYIQAKDIINNSTTTSTNNNSTNKTPDTMTNEIDQLLSLLDNKITIGSRKSPLAVKQSEIVLDQIKSQSLKSNQLNLNILKISTLGDKNQDRPLYSFGGKSVWTTELENALFNNEIDMIAHSLKDVPTSLPKDFELAAILEREDPRDAVVMKSNSKYTKLSDLPDGSLVGTSSVRRSSQLLKNFPNLKFKSIRGSLNTRLQKLDSEDSEFSCCILAAAGLLRLEMGSRISEYLNDDQMLYAVGQGAIGIEINKNNDKIKKLCQSHLNHLDTSIRCLAERSLLRHLEGGCSLPVGVSTEYNSQTSKLSIKAVVLNLEGTEHIEHSIENRFVDKSEFVKDSESIGEELASIMLQNGAREILDSINLDQISQIKADGITNAQQQ